MKNLYTAGVLSFLLFTAYTTIAQVEPPLHQQVPDKPLLFSSLPDKFECNILQLQTLFSGNISDRTNLKLGADFHPQAIVSGIFKKSPTLISINIKLPEYDDALFTISLVNDENGNRYLGRIVNSRYGDMLLLEKEKNKYYFVKQQQRFIMVE